MTPRRDSARGAPFLLALFLTANPSAFGASDHGVEIKVLAAGATKAAATDLSASFAPPVRFSFDTPVRILKRLASGETADLVIVTAEAARGLEREGLLAGAPADLGKARIGVGIKEGAAAPDISTPEALKKTLLSARSVAYMDPARGATSGVHFAKVLGKLGIAGELKSKTILVSSGASGDKVASGEAELCVQQVTEILPVKGVKLAGLLPAELQKTTIYTAAVLLSSPRRAEAEAFLRYLLSPAGRRKFAAAGFQEPD